MPTYNARCIKCKTTIQYQSNIVKCEDTPPCPKCGGETKRVFTKPEGGFILKGQGWFKKGGY
jgi:putative FmdB family regulatory protein